MANTYYDSQLTAAEIEAALEAIDGVIVPANNGKVLAINNGKLEARSVQWSGGGAVVQPLSVTQNGTYNPPSGVDGYAPVTVNVSGGGSLTASIGELFRHIMFSNSASDKVQRNDRWFQRNSNEPVIFLASASDVALSYTGYAGISFSANGITGTYSQHGDLVTLVSKTTPNGTPYYVQKMNGQYPPSVASGILKYDYGQSNYFFNYIPNSSTILYNTALQDFIGSQSLIDSLNAFIDAMYQEYYAN